MEVLYFLLWTVVVAAIAYALFQLGKLFSEVRKEIVKVSRELVPLLQKVNESVDQVNKELEKVDAVVGSVEELSKRVNASIEVLRSVVSSPLIKLAGLSAGVKKAIEVLMKGK